MTCARRGKGGLALLLAALCWVLLGAPLLAQPGAPPATLDRAAYLALLHRALDDVAAAQAAPANTREQAVARALADLPPAVQVVDAAGPLAHVDLSAPRAALGQQPPDLDAAHDDLLAVLRVLDPGSLPSPVAPPAPTPGPGTPTALPVSPTPAYLPAGGPTGAPLSPTPAGPRLDQILADPRFHPDPGSGIQRALADALQPAIAFFLALPDLQRNALLGAIAGLLVAFMIFSGYRDAPWSRRRYLGTVAGGGVATALVVFLLLTFAGGFFAAIGGLLVPVLSALGVVVALGVLTLAAAGLRRARGPGGAAARSGFAAEAGWTAAQARAAAAAAAAGGDFRGAIRYRYLAALLTLDENGRLRFDPALTNQEYLRRAPVALHDALGPLVLIFDRLWYGGYPATAAEYAAYQALAARAETTQAEAGA